MSFFLGAMANMDRMAYSGCTGIGVFARGVKQMPEAYGARQSRPPPLGLKSCIPPKANRNDPAAYHKGYYKHRHHVENFFGRIKEKRAIATRYEKLASRFMGFVSLASIYDWLC